jgi:putative holliday junction resolvase
MKPGRLLGIDHGLKRIGLAVCDESQLVARELAVIRRKSRQEDFDRINHIAREKNAAGVIVGLPSSEAPAGVHTQADTVRLWVERFSETTNLPILLWDEQLSSEDARQLAHRRKRKLGEPIDDLAARVILQSYLDALRDGLAPPVLR